MRSVSNGGCAMKADAYVADSNVLIDLLKGDAKLK